MKKIIFAVLAFCLLLAVPKAQAQPYYKEYAPNEISVGYGVSLLGSAFSSIVSKAAFVSSLTDDEDAVIVNNSGTRGWINLGYAQQLNRVISVGGALGYYNAGVKMTDKTGTANLSLDVFTLMGTGKFDWFRTRSDIFGMYSKVGLGVMMLGSQTVEDGAPYETHFLPTFHASLIGLELGRAFSGFMELGIGMQGIAQFGIKFRF